MDSINEPVNPLKCDRRIGLLSSKILLFDTLHTIAAIAIFSEVQNRRSRSAQTGCGNWPDLTRQM
ncbi:hypothetical protein [Lyngbya sp. CCY1209]|uniref:hypothetical protein n=1 Tax=Lyngbya sp. CCY1209 TaxID=2886103 RepID=UPI002D20AA86|nr:hypothetical protein [Lyngbya sp. CCY1209]MEB3884876.1 hypothetical protein [Lyngbya sp. CCY1209]